MAFGKSRRNLTTFKTLSPPYFRRQSGERGCVVLSVNSVQSRCGNCCSLPARQFSAEHSTSAERVVLPIPSIMYQGSRTTNQWCSTLRYGPQHAYPQLTHWNIWGPIYPVVDRYSNHLKYFWGIFHMAAGSIGCALARSDIMSLFSRAMSGA